MSTQKRDMRKRKPKYSKRSNASDVTKSRRDRDEATTTSKDSSLNDPSWYANNPQMLKDAASLAFSNVLGLPISFDDGDQANLPTVYAESKYVPGIMCTRFLPSVGVGGESYSAINVAARNLYANIRYANSGRANYEAPDLMMYVLASSQVYAYIASLIRIYGLANLYNGRNRYIPRPLLQSMNVDFDDIIKNLSDFRYYINQLIAKASVLWIPSTMPLTVRWFWMNSNVYADADDPKAQLYFYHQEGYWKFNPTLLETGGGLELVKITEDRYDQRGLTSLIRFGEQLINPLIENEDIGIMAGDLLKAFGAGRIFTLAQIPDNYVCVPQHNPEPLMQLSNSYAIPMELNEDNSWNVKQSAMGYLEFNPVKTGSYLGGALAASYRKMLDLGGAENTPENVMVATRLVPITRVDEMDTSAKTGAIKLVSCGTEVITQYDIITLVDGEISKRSFTNYMHTGTTTNTLNIAALSKFKYAPCIYCIAPQTDAIDAVIKSIDNYTTIGAHELTKMNDTAIISEFGVPYLVTGK